MSLTNLSNEAVNEFAGFAVVSRVVIDVLVQVKSSVVQQLKGAHGVAKPQLDSHVNVLIGCVTSFHHRDGILDVRTEQGIHDEPRSVLASHSVLSDGLAPPRHCLIGGV